ncbi:MAG: C4-dicarboxylate ABC transporter substrate-binding protein, partial [Hyphomicrobiales bacterium]
MATLPAWLLRRETLLLAGAALPSAGGVAAWVLLQATVLTIAVAPRDGTEPGLIKAAYADALDAAH